MSDSILKLLEKQATGLIRTSTIDGLIDPPSSSEVQLSINMAVNEINANPPISNMTLEQMWAKSAFQYLLVIGTVKYILTSQVSDWTHNGIEGTIDQFTAQNRLGDYTALLDRFTTEFSEKLSTIKPFAGRRVGSTIIATPKISPVRDASGLLSQLTPLPVVNYRIK